MSVPILVGSRRGDVSSEIEKKFIRLQKKVQNLQKKIVKKRALYEEALQLYGTYIDSDRKELSEVIRRFLLEIHPLITPARALTKSERTELKELLQEDLFLLLEMESGVLPEGLEEIYLEVMGESIEETRKEEFSEFLRSQEGETEDIDISDWDFSSSPEELLRRYVQEKIHQKEEEPFIEETLFPSSKASSSQKELGSVYKKLAKELHPDLEQDPIKREEKIEKMKQLTAAYESRDLLALLSLEAEHFTPESDTVGEETVQAYITVLEEKVALLTREWKQVEKEPRYFRMFDIVRQKPEAPGKCIMGYRTDLREAIDRYASRLEDVRSDKPLVRIKNALREPQGEIAEIEEMLLRFFEGCASEGGEPKKQQRKKTTGKKRKLY